MGAPPGYRTLTLEIEASPEGSVVMFSGFSVVAAAPLCSTWKRKSGIIGTEIKFDSRNLGHLNLVHGGQLTDNREEDVVQHEGGVDQGHDDALAGGAPVPGRQGSEAAEAAQQLHGSLGVRLR